MPTVRAAAERVLMALRDGDVPHRSDAMRIRMSVPEGERGRPLEEIAKEVLKTDKANSADESH
jgi:hypothetical protein